MIKQMTYYLQGKLTEEETVKLWKRLLWDDRLYKYFLIYFSLQKFLVTKKRKLY